MKDYKKLNNLISKHYDKELKETKKRIDLWFKGELENESYINNYLTKLKLDQYNKKELSKKKAKELAYKKAIKENEKDKAYYIKNLSKAQNAETINTIRVSIDWVKSRVWNYNPHAFIEIWTTCQDGSHNYHSYKGSASGCGYDKRSAATSEAFCQSYDLLSLLYDLKEKHPNKNNHNLICYGAGYGLLPYFEGGVGYSCHENILNKLGFERVSFNEGKTYDFYEYKRKESKRNRTC